MDFEFYRYAALFCFSAASCGFLLFRFRYPKRSPVRLWGIRISHLLGFLGVVLHRAWIGEFNEITLLMVAALTVSLLGFELSEHFLD